MAGTTREDRILHRSQDPRTVDARRNDDPADVGYMDDEATFAKEGDQVLPIDLLFK